MRLIGIAMLAGVWSLAQTDTDKVSYALGAQMGMNFGAQGIDVNVDRFMAGLNEGLAGNTSMTPNEISDVLRQFQTELRAKQQESQAASASKNAQEAEAFLAKNKQADGVKTTESGLQYKVETAGTGKSPSADDKVRVHYTGKLIDGTVFDSSVERGTPAEFPVSGVIQGWTEALQLMKEGGKWTLFIPAGLGYGDRGAGQKIPPGAALIFEVELLKVL